MSLCDTTNFDPRCQNCGYKQIADRRFKSSVRANCSIPISIQVETIRKQIDLLARSYKTPSGQWEDLEAKQEAEALEAAIQTIEERN